MTNFHQFMQVSLGRWVIMGNVFLIIEEYGHLKRQPGKTVQYFSARGNKKYHSMLADIRPSPGVALLQYPNALNPEVAFQVKERDIAILKEIPNIAVDVEVNLLNREAKFKTEEELT